MPFDNYNTFDLVERLSCNSRAQKETVQTIC